MPRHSIWFLALLLFFEINANAGVTNPDISAIGQVLGTYTDDTLSQAPKQFALSLGETELVLDAALNPYLKGVFVFSIDRQKGIDVEEAYTTLVRGLPLNLALKAGKYRLNFGKLNQSHPHAYPFIRTPRVLDPQTAKLLPGEGSFNDTAVQVSTLIPMIGSWTTILSADFLQGDSFHPDTSDVAHGLLTHISNSFMAGPASVDIGGSLTQGINNIKAETKSTIIGSDAKAKIVLSPLLTITIAGEYLYKLSERPDSQGSNIHDDRYGFYAYTDVRFYTRYNGGVLYEQYQDPLARSQIDRAIKPFVGFSVLEESTILRLSYEYFMSGAVQRTGTFELQLLFSMGPHKAHQF
ncbi:MAG: hypothetical protein Q8O92_09245 [Candidatus Latescibacter sp.]|nr:hypothetical protein [Candidatus Latescibacter sp.]